MQKQWLEHFCKYRHICEFLGNEGKEKEEIKKYLCAGNPIWDVDKVSAVMSEAIEAVEKQKAKKPEPLTDAEQRIFLSAMERELEVCKEIDSETVREAYEVSLTRICKEIQRKVKGALWT